MKKRIWSLLSFLLIAAMLCSSYTVSGAEKKAEETAQVIRNIFYAVETGGQIYGKCRYDDVTAAYSVSQNETAITIGAGQWMGNQAKALLELIQTTDAELFARLDTAGIASDLEMSSWKNYDIDPDGEKGTCIAAIISSDVGKKCQDKKMDEQIQSYLQTAKDAGITDLGGQVMYAETMHCGGKGAADRILGHTEEPYNAENYYKALTTTWPEDAGFHSPISGPEGSTYYLRHTKIYGWVKEFLLDETENDNTSDGSTGNDDSAGGSTGSDGNTGGSAANGGNTSGSATGDESGSKDQTASARKTYWEKTASGKWYLYDSDGSCLTGWQYVNGKWYFLSKTDVGVMRYDWQLIDGKWYYLGGRNDGAMKSGWQKIDGDWYHFGGPNDGTMKMGWQKIGENWYYFSKDDGTMQIDWQRLGGKWYYLSDSLSDGSMKIGWQKIDEKWYYLSDSLSDGSMKTGWQKIDDKWYYFYSSGSMASNTYVDGYYIEKDGSCPEKGGQGTAQKEGWYKDTDGKWYLYDSDGTKKTGWQTVNGKKYYLSESDGEMKSGWLQLEGKWYYLGEAGDGSLKTGWQTVNGKKYYLSESDGEMKSGWLQLESKWYYFGEVHDGSMKTGWQKIKGHWYYLNTDDGVMKTGWQEIKGKKYYLSESSGAMNYGWLQLEGKWYYFGGADDGSMKTGWQVIGSKWYYFYSEGHMAADTYIGDYYVDENGVWIENPSTENLFLEVSGGQRTIKNLLQNAMKPVGSTLYIWGGGHDTGSGGDGTRYGVNPQWKTFYDSQNAGYDYKKYLYSYKNGLDCSGFVGWAVYNTVYTKSEQSWSTTTSYYMASTLANRNYAGTGKTGGTLLKNPTVFKSGDVVSMNGHTYIVIGQCSDGSLVLVHATPPAVQISGTITPDGNWNSEARQLAQSYMKKYYPDWYFSSQGCGLSYLKGSGSYPLEVNRWTTDGSGIFKDPDSYQSMSAGEVLADLFNE